MPSLNPFRRQQPDRPTLRQRAADLKAGLSRPSRPAEPTVAPQAVVGPAAAKASILSRIAQHRIARDRWTDSVNPADRAWRLQRGLDVSAEAVAAAEAERDAADALVTATWNSLFETPPASSAELLALLRHAQHYVDEDHAPNDAIELSGMVRAIGDAVEALRAQPLPDFEAASGIALSDRFLIDLAPMLLPLLDDANAEWAKVQVLYKQAEEACGQGPEYTESETAYQTYRGKFDVALIATGYTAAWEAIQPAFERIEAMVGPLMNVPVQSLEGLILKQRIGQTLPHYEEDAARDLGRLAKAYWPGEPVSRPAHVLAPPRPQGSLVDQIDFASATMEDLRSLYDIADTVSATAYAFVWGSRCKAPGSNGQYNAAGKLMQWLGDALTEVESAAIQEARQRTLGTQDDREIRLQLIVRSTIENGDLDEIRELAGALVDLAAEQEA